MNEEKDELFDSFVHYQPNAPLKAGSVQKTEQSPMEYPKTVYMQLKERLKSNNPDEQAALVNLYNECAESGEKIVANSSENLNALLKGKPPFFIAIALGGGKYNREDPWLHVNNGHFRTVAKLSDQFDIDRISDKIVDQPSLGEKFGFSVDYLKTFVQDQVKLLNGFKRTHLLEDYSNAAHSVSASIDRVADWLKNDPEWQKAAEKYEVETDPHAHDFMPFYVKVDQHLEGGVNKMQEGLKNMAKKTVDLATEASKRIQSEFRRRM